MQRRQPPGGEFSVLRFPTADPTRARIVSTPDVIPPTATDAVGCHDTGVLIRSNKRDLAVAACLGAFAILNIERPANPACSRSYRTRSWSLTTRAA